MRAAEEPMPPWLRVVNAVLLCFFIGFMVRDHGPLLVMDGFFCVALAWSVLRG